MENIMDFSKKIVVSENVFVQEIDDEIVMLDMNSENYFGLNNIGSEIWKLMQEKETIQEIYEAMKDAYDIDGETLKNDIENLFANLEKNRLVIIK